MKIGRNDPCPCGSGKKWKKCHGMTEQLRYLTDVQTELIRSSYIANIAPIHTVTEETLREIVQYRNKFLFQDSGEDIEEVQKRLVDYAVNLENLIHVVLSQSSPIFLVSLERRFQAWRLLPRIRTLPGDELGLLRDIQHLQTALFFKHGSFSKKDWEPAPDGTLQINFTESNVIDLKGRVLTLCNELFNIPLLYRRVGKGAELFVNRAGQLQAKLDNRRERCLKFYQERRRKFSLTLSPGGVARTFEITDAPDPTLFTDHTGALFFMDYNADPDIEIALTNNRNKVRGPGFLPKIFFLGPIFEFLQIFESRLNHIAGLTLQELRFAITALNTFIIGLFAGMGAYTCLTRGLALSEKKWMISKLVSETQKVCEQKNQQLDAALIVEKFLGHLLWTPEKRTKYDVMLRRGWGCLLYQGSLAIFDLTLLPQAIGEMLSAFDLTGTMLNMKGSAFEKVVTEKLQRDVAGLKFPIPPGRPLKRRESRGMFVQADVYLQQGRYLVLVECKAYSVTYEYLKGEARNVTNRWQLVQSWINEVDKKARIISETKEPLNYSIPREITHFIPLVCTAFPEYIAEADRHWFLTPDIPRACTYPELVEFLNQLSELLPYDMPFAVSVSSHRP